MKTAMKELLEWAKNSDMSDTMISPQDLLNVINPLLEKEKEQIVNDFENGYKACDLDEALEINKTMFSGERYFNQTYNQ
jgi:hypothetical protein